MARSDFNMIDISHHFTKTFPVVTKHFPIEGVQKPVDDAYLLLQVQGISTNHAVDINGKSIGGLALAAAPGESQAWRLGFTRIPPGVLRTGDNTIKITRNATQTDDFRVSWAVVNWRE